MLKGKAIVLGDDVNTDLLHPPAFFSPDDEQAVAGAFAGLEIDLESLGPPPYIVVAGTNFGCGSSRESTVRALKRAGVVAVAARSFSHIFHRNALAVGIWPLVRSEDEPDVATGSDIEIDPEVPEPFERDILRAGGLRPHLEASGWDWPARGAR